MVKGRFVSVLTAVHIRRGQMDMIVKCNVRYRDIRLQRYVHNIYESRFSENRLILKINYMKLLSSLIFIISGLSSFAQVLNLSSTKLFPGTSLAYDQVNIVLLDSIAKSQFSTPKIQKGFKIFELSISPDFNVADTSISKHDKELATFRKHLLFFEDEGFSYFALDANNNRSFEVDEIVKEPTPTKDIYNARSFEFNFKANRQILRKDRNYISERIVYPKIFTINGQEELVLLSNTYRETNFIVGAVKCKVGVRTFYSNGDQFAEIYAAPDSLFSKKLSQVPNSVGDTILIGGRAIVLDSVTHGAKQIIIKNIQVVREPFGINEGENFKHFEALDYFTNEPISTAANASNGIYTVIDFWGTWCGPCLQSFPELKRILTANGDRKLSVISVAAENKLDSVNVASVIKKYGLTWSHIVLQRMKARLNPDTPTSIFRINSFPTLIILAPNGKILFRAAGNNHLKEFAQILAKIPMHLQ
jgi:thiol-disulfide isomerase/thioredoxin